MNANLPWNCLLAATSQALPQLADGERALDQGAQPRVLRQELLGGVPLRRATGQPQHEEGPVPPGRPRGRREAEGVLKLSALLTIPT